MSLAKKLFLSLYFFNAVNLSAFALQGNVALFRIEEQVYWSNQMAPIVKNIMLLDCVFGESTLLEIFPKIKNLNKILNCSLQQCNITIWSKHHKELMYLITVLKTVELLKRRGGPFLTRLEQEKLLAPNAKSCHLPRFETWSKTFVEFINAELMYQDFLADSPTSTNDSGRNSKQNSLKRDIESLSHTLFYVPEI